VTDLGSCLNVGWAHTDRPPAYYLASAIPDTGIAFLGFLFAAKLLIQATISDFIRVYMTVNGLVANNDLIGNLDEAPLR